MAVTPLDKARDVPTDTTVLVAAASGTLQKVDVKAVKGAQGSLQGVLSADGTQWHSRGTAAPGASYEVTATAVNPAGEVTERTTSFSTVKGGQTFAIESLMPSKDTTGLTVGVGMPVMIAFDKDVTDRVSIERNLLVHTSKPVLGRVALVRQQDRALPSEALLAGPHQGPRRGPPRGSARGQGPVRQAEPERSSSRSAAPRSPRAAPTPTTSP